MDKIIDLYKKAYDDYALAICDVEIELHRARSKRLSGRIQHYFNSTANRNTFARIMSKAFILKKPVTITEICKLLHVNRSSVSIMVDECVKEGWVSVERKNNKALCMATEELYIAMMKYVHYRKVVSRSIIGTYWKTLDQLESVLTQTETPLPDMSFGEDNVVKLHLEEKEVVQK